MLDSPTAPLEQDYLTYKIGWLARRRLGIPAPLSRVGAKFQQHHRRSSETSGRYGCDSNLCNRSRKPFCRLDHNQFLYSFMHNTADVHSLDFAAHCTPFHPETPPSSWAVVSQRVHSPLYSHPHEYLLQYLSNTLSGGGKQTHSYPFVDQSNASILWTAPRPPSRSFRGLLV